MNGLIIYQNLLQIFFFLSKFSLISKKLSTKSKSFLLYHKFKKSSMTKNKKKKLKEDS